VDGVLHATLIDDIWNVVTQRVAAHSMDNYRGLIASCSRGSDLPPTTDRSSRKLPLRSHGGRCGNGLRGIDCKLPEHDGTAERAENRHEGIGDTAAIAGVSAKLAETITRPTAALRTPVVTARALRVARPGPPQSQPKLGAS